MEPDFQRVKKLVSDIEGLLDKFYEERENHKYFLVFAEVTDLARLKKEGYPMWEDTKDNLLRTGRHGLLIGLKDITQNLGGAISLNEE